MPRHVRLVALAVAAAVQGAAPAQPPAAALPASPATPSTHFDPGQVPDPAQVLALLDASATAQIAQLRTTPVGLTGNGPGLTANWISAAFLTGLTRLTRLSDASGGRALMRDVAEHFNFGFKGNSSPHGMLDADNVAIGELYEELYALSGEPGEIAPLRQRLDATLPYLAVTPAPHRLVWWWCDALFMAPPVFARMAVLSQDPSYLQAMDVQWWRQYDRLWSPAAGLFLRDERFATRRTRHDKPVFWGRGNGWVVAGIARVLESMPADFAHRPRYIETLRTMAASIAKLQRADGLWTTNLLDPEDPPGPETSGSAFFVYALAWGINHGVLDRATYLPVVLKGWAGLAAAVQPDGLLGYAQRPGDQPMPSTAADHALYGTGGLLLAGLEMMNLGKPVTALPLSEPPRDPARASVLPIELKGAAPSDPARRAAYQRAAAERDAMAELAFEPARDMPGAEGTAPAPPPRADGIVNPRMTVPLAPPPPAQRAPRATVRYAPYRFDDILWENDRTAHRIYGPALEKAEPPSSSGIDAWGKDVVWPFMERQLATGKQHDFHGEGIDFYNVNSFRGAGGLGICRSQGVGDAPLHAPAGHQFHADDLDDRVRQGGPAARRPRHPETRYRAAGGHADRRPCARHLQLLEPDRSRQGRDGHRAGRRPGDDRQRDRGCRQLSRHPQGDARQALRLLCGRGVEQGAELP
jgi:hypothetical protein